MNQNTSESVDQDLFPPSETIQPNPDRCHTTPPAVTRTVFWTIVLLLIFGSIIFVRQITSNRSSNEQLLTLNKNISSLQSSINSIQTTIDATKSAYGDLELNYNSLKKQMDEEQQHIAELTLSVQSLSAAASKPQNDIDVRQKIEALTLKLQGFESQLAVTKAPQPNKNPAPAKTVAKKRASEVIQPPPRLPMELVAIDVWNNVPLALLEFNGLSVQAKAGQDLAGWTITDIDVQSRAVTFQHIATSYKSILTLAR